MGRITVNELAEQLGVTRQSAHVLCDTYGVAKEVRRVKLGGRTYYAATVLESHVKRIPNDRPNGVRQ